MEENPYQSPPKPISESAHGLDENTKEYLGIAKDDFWYYPAFVLLLLGVWMRLSPVSLGCFAISTFFLTIYLLKSFPKYLGIGKNSAKLTTTTKVYGFMGNLALIGLQVVLITGRFVVEILFPRHF